MPRRTYFFDLDGTLTDAREGLFYSFRAALKALGLGGVSNERLEQFLGTPLPEMFRVLKPTISRKEIMTGIEAFRAAYEAGGIAKNTLYPGVIEMLESISRSDDIAWIVTSKPQPYAETVAKSLGIDHFVGGITGANLDENDTKGELVARALHDADVAPSDAIMLGDRFYDIAGARENDVTPVGALWGYGTYEELHGAGCELFAKSPAEFQEEFIVGADHALAMGGRAPI